jgi:hypothetical protein
MAGHTFERTRLWQGAFLPQGDAEDAHRQRLQTALERFRERVGHLLTFIPADMRHYTVHDLSHLDALWEIAELIVGDDFPLNPAEAFVLGGAILLHDAGMTVAAYPGGVGELRSTREWQDAYALISRSPSGVEKSAEEQELELAAATTNALRLLHARKAEELAVQPWRYPAKADQTFLLEDSDLRNHYGALIGKIAHSHHWDVQLVCKQLASPLGAFGEMPVEWTVDAIKVALLLRCADAAHIDHRRAPRLLLTLTRPTGISRAHWQFQSKLSKPQIIDRKLLYTSSSASKLRTPMLGSFAGTSSG